MLIHISIVPLRIDVLFKTIDRYRVRNFQRHQDNPNIDKRIGQYRQLSHSTQHVNFGRNLVLNTNSQGRNTIAKLTAVKVSKRILLKRLITSCHPLQDIKGINNHRKRMVIQASIVTKLINRRVMLMSIRVTFINFRRQKTFTYKRNTAMSIKFIITSHNTSFTPQTTKRYHTMIFSTNFSGKVNRNIKLLLTRNRQLFVLMSTMMNITFLLRHRVGKAHSDLTSPVRIGPHLQFKRHSRVEHHRVRRTIMA